MKQTLIWFNLQRHGTRNGLSNVNLHQSLRILKAGLSSSDDVMAGQNIKKKYLMCQISIKITKQHTDIQFQTQFYITQRLIHQKGAEKLVKDELYMM